MAQIPDNPTVPQVVNYIWDLFEDTITSRARSEIILPADIKSIIGEHGIQTLVDRFR